MKDVQYKPATSRTIGSFDALRGQLKTVKEKGWALDDGEYEDDLHCVGAAVKNYRGRVIACISISVPALRFNPQISEDLGKAVKEAADKISYSVGFTDKQ